ncbi:hypothetical protein CTEN210_09932 [Chaetoceros tenuissimus]|uniref:Carboxymuconolactone decarboxylase-like domain-containing protein n=1 Tax=Chaetoceros tenuissimus TaxID=426638 RepID=A0AAD3CWD9_9STRA|nr:hypothetical protein CTEN210_09932 [Chaetoceros tenuissimus]
MTEESLEDKLPPYKTTSHKFVPRYTGPKEKDLTQEQKDIRDEILSTRKRTGLAGPFGPWLARPNIASPAQKLGKACRYDTNLSFRESELVILLTASKFKSHAEFDIHQGEALRAGLSLDVIQSIPRDDEFSHDVAIRRISCTLEKEVDEGKSSAHGLQREIAIVCFTAELLDTATVSDDTYQRTKQILGGDEVLVDITSIVGYYTYVAYTLNVFKIPSKPPIL